MSTVVVTGSCGLIGSEACKQFHSLGHDIVGIDNNARQEYFGSDGSTNARYVPWQKKEAIDIRDRDAIDKLFIELGQQIVGVVHTAAQPSHDWSGKHPFKDFEVNVVGTMNVLEATRMFAPEASFIFCSSSKVYGDVVNRWTTNEHGTRHEVLFAECNTSCVNEAMPIDQSMHSPYGAGKTAADLYVQEYGRYYGMNTVCFRGNCMTGKNHSGVPLHGFLSYLCKCAVTGETYYVNGFGGKQVRDNIHAEDYVSAMVEWFKHPGKGHVFNIGGGRERACSILEAVDMLQGITGKKMNLQFEDKPRLGDHKWYITDNTKFQQSYPSWHQKWTLRGMLVEMVESHRDLLSSTEPASMLL